jgi:hypothetical protein
VRHGELVVAGSALATASFGLVGNLVINTVGLAAEWRVAFWIILVELVAVMVVLAVRQDRAQHRGHDIDPAAGASQQPNAALGETRRRFVGKLPPRAGAFQERRAGAKLSAALADQGTAVLLGVGGAGKTQLAADYACTVWDSRRVDVLVWIDAASRDKILRGMRAAAAAVFGVDDRDSQRAADRLLGWLAATDLHWLVVFDDLRDPQDLHELGPYRTRFGKVVVTTRRGDATSDRQVVEVGPFTLDESAKFLTERLAGRPAQADGATELAEALGCLPKGLAQAAAYIADSRGLTCRAYVDLLDDPHRPLSHLLPDQLPDGQRDTVAAMWSWSMDQANRSTPTGLARPLLALAALLDPKGVPETVFTSAAAGIYLRTTSRRAVTPESVERTLACLHRFGLVTYEPKNPHKAVRVHPLVRRAVHEMLTRRDMARAARAAANALLQAWPTIERDSSQVQVLRDNVAALRKTAGAYLWHRRARAVLFRPGHSLGGCGKVAAARDYFGELVDGARIELRHGHPTILRARASHAHWQGEAGNPGAAAAALKELVLETQQKFGRKRPFTLKVRRSYARWLSDAGDPVGAAKLAGELIPDFVRCFGPEGKDTLYARNILVRCLADAGQLNAAAELMRELVADFVRILGDDHLDTLSARNNLAVMHCNGDDPAGAAAEFTELLKVLDRVLGPDNPKTLRTRDNLAHALARAGE